MDYSDRIKPDDSGIVSFIEGLEHGNYQIPTFQRNVAWDAENIKKLWDSIFKFYPIGSLLIWKTDEPLEYHRKIGGHHISKNNGNTFNYLLDGQQRATSIFLSCKGQKGDVAKDLMFDPIVYVDLTYEYDEEDEFAYRSFFYFWNEIEYREKGYQKRNKSRQDKYDKGLIVKLYDVYERFGKIEENLMQQGFSDYDSIPRKTLRKIDSVIKTYRISYILLQGIKVREVCDIFERVNTEGKALDVVDIIVAKTYSPSKNGDGGFYLRNYLNELKEKLEGSQFSKLSDFIIMQIFASIIMQDEESKVKNITNTYLPKIKASEIDEIWEDTSKAILDMQKFFEERLHLVGPNIIPYGYMYPALVNFFYKTEKPDISIAKQWFWSTAFSSEDFDSTTKLKDAIGLLKDLRDGKTKEFPKITIYKDMIKEQTYTARGAKSRAVLALMAYMKPSEFSDPDRDVLHSVYRQLLDRPNLHHFFPKDHLAKHPEQKDYVSDPNTLLNIIYLPQIENLTIANKNPLEYLKYYEEKTDRFEEILSRHLIPTEVLDWIRDDNITWADYDDFIEKRLDLIMDKIKELLPGVDVEIK